MDKSLLDSEGLNLRYGEGTVGEFLQRGKAGLSLHNLWQLSLLLFFVLVTVAFIVNIYGQRIDAIVETLTGSVIVSSDYLLWVILACVLFALITAVLIVLSFLTRGISHDRRRQLRSQVISIMAKNPRYPVGMKTQLTALGLRCIYIKGSRAIECTSRYPFVAEDFAQGCMSSQAAAHSLFNAYDFEVFKGKLFVYYDKEAAEELREKRYRKGAGRHA